MTRLICITGMDGVGKSTLIKKVSAAFPSCYIADIWDLLNSPIQSLPFKSKNEIDDFLCALTPDSRLLFLAHALKYSIDKAFESKNEIIIADSYFYKYLATELALGVDEKLAHAIEISFPEPNLIIELTLPVELCADRKTKYSKYECGLDPTKSKQSFINFQNKAAKYWKKFNHKNWNYIDAIQDSEAIFNQCLEVIKK